MHRLLPTQGIASNVLDLLHILRRQNDLPGTRCIFDLEALAAFRVQRIPPANQVFVVEQIIVPIIIPHVETHGRYSVEMALILPCSVDMAKDLADPEKSEHNQGYEQEHFG